MWSVTEYIFRTLNYVSSILKSQYLNLTFRKMIFDYLDVAIKK